MTGPAGLLKALTKTVLETALNEEMTEHLGHEKGGRPEQPGGNVRNGTRPKTVLTENTGEVEIDVPRDRAAASGRRSSRNANVACPGWTKWCCRSTPKA